MKSEVSGDVATRYRNLLSVLEKNFKYLDSVGLEAQVAYDYKKLLSHLRSATLADMYTALERKAGPPRPAKDAISLMTNEEIGRLTIKEIRQKISSSSITRASIEKVAAVRFGVSKSGLSALKSRDALVEKIENLLLNEGAHEIISRSAALIEARKLDSDD